MGCRRWLTVGMLLLSTGCQPLAVTPAVAGREATVVGEWPRHGGWHTTAVALKPVVLVQAEIGGPGMTQPLTATAAIGSDFRFVVPFANVPLGDNRPVTVTGFAADGRAVPGAELHGWLSVSVDGSKGQTSAAATPVGKVLARLWQQSASEAVAGVLARSLAAEALLAQVTALSAASGIDYSLFDADAIASVILAANRNRSSFDIIGSGVRVPALGGAVLHRPVTVQGTLYGLLSGDTVKALAVDDPLSPNLATLPTAAGTPFEFFPVVPGARRLSVEVGTNVDPAFRLVYSREFLAADGATIGVDASLPDLSPRQVPPGGAVRLKGDALGSSSGSATIGFRPSPASLSVVSWSEPEVVLAVSGNQAAGPQPLRVNGSGWRLDVAGFQVLPGPPVVETVSVSGTAGTRTLVVSGQRFSAFGRDHVVTLSNSDGTSVPLPVTVNAGKLEGRVPAGLTGTLAVDVSIGGVAASHRPEVTL